MDHASLSNEAEAPQKQAREAADQEAESSSSSLQKEGQKARLSSAVAAYSHSISSRQKKKDSGYGSQGHLKREVGSDSHSSKSLGLLEAETS